jgi:hypothetical protein
MDLSHQGVKIQVPECLPFAEKVKLQFDVAELDLNFETEGEVCWSRPGEKDTWFIGCTVAPKIADEVFWNLATNGYIDRRQSFRIVTSYKALASWELNDSKVPVEIVDYSAHGFCIAADKDTRVGKRVMLHLTRPDGKQVSIAASVRWSRVVEQERLVGCELLHSKDARHLRSIVAQDDLTPFLRLGDAARQRTGYLVFAVLLAAVSSSVVATVMKWQQHASEQQQEPMQLGERSLSTFDEDGTSTLSVVSRSKDQGASEQSLGPLAEVEPPRHHDTPVETEGLSAPVSALAGQTDDQTRPPHSRSLDAQRDGRPTSTSAERIEDATSALSAGVDDGSHQTETVAAGSRREANSQLPPPDASPAKPAGSGLPASARAATETRETGPTLSSVGDPRIARLRAIEGIRAYHHARFAESTMRFKEAVENDRMNSRYFYLLAMSLYRQNRMDIAQRAADRAVELEQLKPIKNWGELMSRFQGPERIWIEGLRAKRRSTFRG